MEDDTLMLRTRLILMAVLDGEEVLAEALEWAEAWGDGGWGRCFPLPGQGCYPLGLP